ncbi:PfkB family carbohydrate kinase [Amycolatopsis rhabdoformis]|uniref:PfkB family carbohydrate kinase n=1 Tax=Amycolatopsis rhabdoformis TaxID=1448059 RepID=A0ABZ1I2V1_9PSEU|nr:PfkB family carbohydrate kinase [Amycolatopsis rhabdoformis]WSE27985.1 PfkB family carbohydrate kinase [Amycolatopsis rhabdoformis]
MSRLIHTGQVVVDLVLTVPRLPTAGGDVLATSTNLLPGGGFNVMAAAARSGADVVYAGTHGTGSFGDLVRAALAAEGITVAHEPTASGDTGVVVALVDPSGERTFATGTGAEGRLRADQLARISATPEDLVYVTGYSLLHAANRDALAQWLPTLPGSRVLFDPGPLVSEVDPQALASVLSTVDIISCNAREAEALDLQTLAETKTVIVRDGPAGCTLHHAGETTQVDGFPVTAVDTNGAGDTHCGVLAAELLSGTDLQTAARRANAAAALSVTRHGPATAPTSEQLSEFWRDIDAGTGGSYRRDHQV